MKSSTQEGVKEQLPSHKLLHGLHRVVCHILGKPPSGDWAWVLEEKVLKIIK